jgi:hypothetical protein
MREEKMSDDESDRSESVGKYARMEHFILTLILKTLFYFPLPLYT